ncbi:ArsR/SmtB family transcription factor [Nonomuraea dietziae]|uniref:ArsR/SmtB family transcription factor n=1 Tax=Nonomuraea dietziae TaxID=65515 RepID=UPI003448577A
MSAQGLASFAALLADPTRAAFCLALLDGRAWTAGELARTAGVAASTASEHLSKMVEGGLLAEERQGRHRYVRLRDAATAQLVEDLAARVSPSAATHTTLRAASAASALARARTCYDHLAGRLGVSVTDALLSHGLLDPGFSLSASGAAWFDKLGIALTASRTRPMARPCLDWTERRPHLAGTAGAALCRHALEAGWVTRIGGQRALKVTDSGLSSLALLLDIPSDTLRPSPN